MTSKITNDGIGIFCGIVMQLSVLYFSQLPERETVPTFLHFQVLKEFVLTGVPDKPLNPYSPMRPGIPFSTKQNWNLMKRRVDFS